MATLVVNVLDAGTEEPLEGLYAIEWPGTSLPLPGERLRVHEPRHDDLQVVRRTFHVGMPTGGLVVDLFVAYVNYA